MTTEQKSEYRCQHGIIEDVLDLLNRAPLRRYRLQQIANLTTKQFERYEQVLTKKGYIAERNDIYSITAAGRNYLRIWQQVKEAVA